MGANKTSKTPFDFGDAPDGKESGAWAKKSDEKTIETPSKQSLPKRTLPSKTIESGKTMPTPSQQPELHIQGQTPLSY